MQKDRRTDNVADNTDNVADSKPFNVAVGRADLVRKLRRMILRRHLLRYRVRHCPVYKIFDAHKLQRDVQQEQQREEKGA